MLGVYRMWTCVEGWSWVPQCHLSWHPLKHSDGLLSTQSMQRSARLYSTQPESYQIKSDCSPLKINTQEASVGRKERCFNQKSWQSEEMATCVQRPSPKILLLLLLSRFSRVRLCGTPQMAAHQAPPSLGFSRQEHWSGLPFPSPMHESEK